MKTKTKYDPPRNRASYEHVTNGAPLSFRSPDWDAQNRAEFYIWYALRLKNLNGVPPLKRMKRRQEYVECLAKARLYLGESRRARIRYRKDWGLLARLP